LFGIRGITERENAASLHAAQKPESLSRVHLFSLSNTHAFDHWQPQHEVKIQNVVVDTRSTIIKLLFMLRFQVE
jgi:hypothetical protein